MNTGVSTDLVTRLFIIVFVWQRALHMLRRILIVVIFYVGLCFHRHNRCISFNWLLFYECFERRFLVWTQLLGLGRLILQILQM